MKTAVQSLQQRKVGKSNLEVSAIGLGCMGMSFSHGWKWSPTNNFSPENGPQRNQETN